MMFKPRFKELMCIWLAIPYIGIVLDGPIRKVRAMNIPLNPTFIGKTGVYRDIPIFLIFAPKHRLWGTR